VAYAALAALLGVAPNTLAIESHPLLTQARRQICRKRRLHSIPRRSQAKLSEVGHINFIALHKKAVWMLED
jgi:hypothetical protein